MTPSQQTKPLGLTVKQVSQLTNTSTQTLDNWCKNKPELFAVVLAGCVAIREQSK